MEQSIPPYEMATLTALQAVIDLLAAKGVATHAEFAQLFHHQVQDAQSTHNSAGVAVAQLLARHCQKQAGA